MSQDSITLTIPVADGRLNPSPMQQANIDGFLRGREGKTATVTFERPYHKRTTEQNKFYWGVILTTIAQHTGHTTEEIHEVVKDLFLPRKFIKLGNREVQIEKSTAKLTFTEFAHYLEQIRAWASQELALTFPELEFTRTRPEPEKVQ